MSEPRKRFINTEFTMSQESYENGWHMPYAHYHNDYEIYILESGTRTVTISDREYTTTSHDATLFPSNVPHKSKGSSAFSGICIHFSQNYLSEHLTPSARELLMRCFAHPVIHLSPDTFFIIKKYAEQFTVSLPENFVLLINILNLLNAQSALTRSSTDDQVDTTKHSKAQQILTYVEENYTSINNIAKLANTFEVSESYIFKLYRKNYHQTPKQHINELRINNACHRLQNTDATIIHIAADCGFDCYEYFIRVFKNIKKCTPSEYRKSARNVTSVNSMFSEPLHT